MTTGELRQFEDRLAAIQERLQWLDSAETDATWAGVATPGLESFREERVGLLKEAERILVFLQSGRADV